MELNEKININLNYSPCELKYCSFGNFISNTSVELFVTGSNESKSKSFLHYFSHDLSSSSNNTEQNENNSKKEKTFLFQTWNYTPSKIINHIIPIQFNEQSNTNNNIENTKMKKSDGALLFSSQVELLLFNNGEYNQTNLIDDEINGYGPISELLTDENITEIMVNGPKDVYVEIEGKLIKDTSISFNNDELLHINYQKILDVMRIPYSCLVKSMAKHTDNVIIVNEKKNEDTADIQLDYLEGVDGLITTKSNIALATTTADCQNMILYDPTKHVLGNIHSGWRGTFQKIVQKAVLKMKDELHCDARDILAFFMPAIRQCHFEVEEDVMSQCKEIFADTNRLEDIIHVGRQVEGVQKYNIDNALLNKIMLIETGILQENIFDSGLCTVCHSDIMNSRRADGEKFNRATVIAMMKE